MKAILLCLLAAAPLSAQPLELQAILVDPPAHMESRPLFQLRLSNHQKQPVTFEYFVPSFWYPELSDQDGKKYRAQYPPYDGPAQKKTVIIEAGKAVVLSSGSCLFTERLQAPEQAFIRLRPGRYTASFQIEKLHSQPLTITVVK